MEEILQKYNQELRLITNKNELKRQQLLNQIDSIICIMLSASFKLCLVY